MQKQNWTIVNDDRIRHIWGDNRGYEVAVRPDFYENNGTPIDPETDEDLTYLRTEILEG